MTLLQNFLPLQFFYSLHLLTDSKDFSDILLRLQKHSELISGSNLNNSLSDLLLYFHQVHAFVRTGADIHSGLFLLLPFFLQEQNMHSQALKFLHLYPLLL